MTISKILVWMWGTLFMLLSCGALSAGFNDNGNGTVTDFATGLTWQQSDTHNSFGRNWGDAFDYCVSLTLDSKSDWRLPQIDELQSIVAYDEYSPAINAIAFPSTNPSNYWSASSYASSSSYAWLVNFNSANVYALVKASANYVRCVR